MSKSFPAALAKQRAVGREAEFPVVTLATGAAADVREILRTMVQMAPGTLAPHQEHGEDQEGPMLVKSVATSTVYTVEVGKGTVEVASGPYDDLHAMKEGHEAAVAPLVAAAAEHGAALLGFGVQPTTCASAELMTAKPHYAALHAAIGDAWLNFTVTASDQLHVDVAAPELIAVTNTLNLLSPSVVALCGNSSVYRGAAGDVCMRETAMAPPLAASRGAPRYGMPARAFADFDDLVATLASLPVLLAPGATDSVADRRAATSGATLAERFAEMGAEEDETEGGGDDAWRAFSLHDHCACCACAPSRPPHRCGVANPNPPPSPSPPRPQTSGTAAAPARAKARSSCARRARSAGRSTSARARCSSAWWSPPRRSTLTWSTRSSTATSERRGARCAPGARTRWCTASRRAGAAPPRRSRAAQQSSAAGSTGTLMSTRSRRRSSTSPRRACGGGGGGRRCTWRASRRGSRRG